MKGIWERLLEGWSKMVFLKRHKEITPKIRTLRALEEMMELAQAEGVTTEECDILKFQVWNKPPGDPKQEVGGVMVCMAGYAATKGLLLEECFWDEYERIITPEIIEKVRYRNLQGDKIGFDKTQRL